MYIPKHFRPESRDEILAHIKSFPLGLLISSGLEGILADPIPMILVQREGGPDVLIGHLAIANPHVKRLESDSQVLVCFLGAQGYVSPNFYPSKGETHRVVPTWNYSVVQVAGRAKLLHDAETKRSIIDALTRAFEGDGDSAWQIDDAPAEFIEAQLRGIVGLEIEIESLDGKWKLSQNKDERDQRGVIEGLGECPLTQAMDKVNKLPDSTR